MLSAARDLFLTFGAATDVERCDRELRAGGVNAVRGERGSVELTAQETAVSDLVATGLSNHEVAAELHVSPKTVQYHLTHVYAKLGVSSRAELAALLGSADLAYDGGWLGGLSVWFRGRCRAPRNDGDAAGHRVPLPGST